MVSAAERLASYTEALRPLIYIQHFDFQTVDQLIAVLAGDSTVYEYNEAFGFTQRGAGKQPTAYNLQQSLAIADDPDMGEFFLVLKDVHFHLREPAVIARLKSIAHRTLYQEGFRGTVLIVSSELIIPPELERFVTVFEFPNPTVGQIEEIIDLYAFAQEATVSAAVKDELALSLKGLNEFEILQILSLAYQQSGRIDESCRQLILEEKQQIIRKSGLLEIINFTETIGDLGGLENLKRWLVRKAEIFKHMDQALKFGVDIPRGLLIVGMPGCGKSLSAKVAAQLFQVPLLRLDVGKLFGKYVGESEENMRRALCVAEAVSPCVLWVDELEKAFAGVGETGGGNQVTTRLLGYFLTWLQEKESTVFIVATANDISKLPPEFLRRGRFDELFAVGFPNADERKHIFQIHLRKRNMWSRNVDTVKLVARTEGYSGADIEAVVKEAVEGAFLSRQSALTTEMLLTVISTTKSLSETLKDKIDEMRKSLTRIDTKQASDL